jgi:hypothetical protein
MSNAATSSNTTESTWTGMVPVEDAALAVSDTGGSGRPVVYLNGAYADRSHRRSPVKKAPRPIAMVCRRSN